MVELFEQYWEVILGISANLLIILKMLGTLKSKVDRASNDTKKLVIMLKNDLKGLHEDNVKQKEISNILLKFIEDETDLKQINKLIPQELKDDYKKIKEEALKLHSEV